MENCPHFLALGVAGSVTASGRGVVSAGEVILFSSAFLYLKCVFWTLFVWFLWDILVICDVKLLLLSKMMQWSSNPNCKHRIHLLRFKFYFWYVSCLNTLFALFRITKNDKSALRFTCPWFDWLFDFLSCSLSVPSSPAFYFSGLVYKYPLSEQWHLVSSILFQIL